jgi:hypothetical protein
MIVIGDMANTGQTGVFEVRFHTHLSNISGDNAKPRPAKQKPNQAGIPIEASPLMHMPITIPATILHVFETFVNTRAQATSAAHQNVNIFDTGLFCQAETISGTDTEMFLSAIKTHLTTAKLKPPIGDTKVTSRRGNGPVR